MPCKNLTKTRALSFLLAHLKHHLIRPFIQPKYLYKKLIDYFAYFGIGIFLDAYNDLFLIDVYEKHI